MLIDHMRNHWQSKNGSLYDADEEECHSRARSRCEQLAEDKEG